LSSGCRVLCIEDDPAQLETLAELLRLWGATVDEASDLAGARTLLELRSYDLILADYNLPDGTAADLWDNPEWDRKIVVVSAAAPTPQRPRGGLVVQKPLTRAKLQRIIASSACSPS
jgi:CheY-like chemotaxis protein